MEGRAGGRLLELFHIRQRQPALPLRIHQLNGFQVGEEAQLPGHLVHLFGCQIRQVQLGNPRVRFRAPEGHGVVELDAAVEQSDLLQLVQGQGGIGQGERTHLGQVHQILHHGIVIVGPLLQGQHLGVGGILHTAQVHEIGNLQLRPGKAQLLQHGVVRAGGSVNPFQIGEVGQQGDVLLCQGGDGNALAVAGSLAPLEGHIPKHPAVGQGLTNLVIMVKGNVLPPQIQHLSIGAVHRVVNKHMGMTVPPVPSRGAPAQKAQHQQHHKHLFHGNNLRFSL